MSRMSREAAETRQAMLSAVVLAAVLVILAIFVSQIVRVLLVVFAAILLAILLNGIARLIERFLPLGHQFALGLGILLVIALLAGTVLLAGPQVNHQISQLGNRLPEAVGQVEDMLRQYPWGHALLNSSPELSELVDGSGKVFGYLSGFFSSAVIMITDTLIILIVGIYIASNPGLYVRGILLLVPPKERARGGEVMSAVGHALGWWLVGQFGAMAIIGALTGIGLWIIGMPLALALGLIAGLFSFIPMLGPVIAAVPGLLVALMEDPMLALYAALVYWIAQIIEGNLVTPMIQKRTVALAPAILITAQLLMGVLFGFNGVVLATPLIVATMVLIQMLYVQDMLDTEVRVLGDHDEDGGDQDNGPPQVQAERQEREKETQ